MEYKTFKIKNVVSFKPGYAFTKNEMSNKGYPLIKIKSIKNNRVIIDANSCITNDAMRMDYSIHYGDILMALTGDPVTKGNIETWVGRTGIYKDERISFLNQRVCRIIPNESIINYEYLYYWLIRPEKTFEIASLYRGSANQANISHRDIGELTINLPNLEIQNKIASILSAFDQKIELNNQQNETLFELGRHLYIEKFENNQNIDKVELGNFFPVITGKKDANASSENGKYPFFTCSKTISKIDDYAFDASAILLAGNGDFNVKFYRGKFDAYQRTYVLIPKNPEYLGFLYWAISYNLPIITANYRGSVIKFITKGNIESFKVPFVDNKYIPTFMKYLEKIEKNNQQNEVLAGLRDVLLPKLMSGEINLNEITINE